MTQPSGYRPDGLAGEAVVRTQLRTHVPSQCLRRHDDDPRNSREGLSLSLPLAENSRAVTPTLQHYMLCLPIVDRSRDGEPQVEPIVSWRLTRLERPDWGTVAKPRSMNTRNAPSALIRRAVVGSTKSTALQERLQLRQRAPSRTIETPSSGSPAGRSRARGTWHRPWPHTGRSSHLDCASDQK